MSNRSRRFGKTELPLTHNPASDVNPSESTASALPQRQPGTPRPWRRPVPHEITAVPKLPVDFRDPSRLPHVAPLAQGNGFAVSLPQTQVLPVVDLTATQPLPVVSQPVPPSARHVDPRAGWSRVHVEDNDLLPVPRGRHVLSELKALPSPDEELAAAEQRVVTAMVTGVPQVKNPALRLAVRMFREARDMARAREARCAQDESRLNAMDARIKEFAQRWAHDDAHWDKVAAALAGKQQASDAGQIEQAYDEGGTQVALGMVTQVKDMIVQRALAGSAVAQ